MRQTNLVAQASFTETKACKSNTNSPLITPASKKQRPEAQKTQFKIEISPISRRASTNTMTHFKKEF